MSEPPADTSEVMHEQNLLDQAVYYRLFEEAEKVRWRMSDLPWKSIAREQVSPEWVRLIRQIAVGELTTFNATERFLQDFGQDVDFTQWLSVWLYEETKHPYALMMWLKAFGETFDSEFMLKGRQAFPFISSRNGMLCTNICSEVIASTLYMALQARAPEPVLKVILRNIGGDEARHASHFYTYAKKLIERSPEPDRRRHEALSVLFVWLQANQRVKHPVNLVLQRVRQPEFGGITPDAFWDEALEKAQRKLFGLFSTLVGRTVSSTDDILKVQRELAAT